MDKIHWASERASSQGGNSNGFLDSEISQVAFAWFIQRSHQSSPCMKKNLSLPFFGTREADKR